MAKLLIDTQYMENYGAHCWDGKGECPQGWKFKGGYSYVCPIPANFPLTQVASLAAKLEAANGLNRSDDYQREYVISWQVVPDNYRSDEERFGIRPRRLSAREALAS